MTEGFVVDGVIAQDNTQVAEFWTIRESITTALKGDGVVYKYDVTLPIVQFYELVELMKERTEGLAITCCGYGHLGDGNLHLNITGPKDKPELLNAIEPFVSISSGWNCVHAFAVL